MNRKGALPRRMFRERRDDNEEAARKRWRGATSGKEVCAERKTGRQLCGRSRDCEQAGGEKEGRDERVAKMNGVREWRLDEERERETVPSRRAVDRKQYKDILRSIKTT